MSKNKKDVEEQIDCFVIMPISNQPNYENEHFTLVYEDIIKPSIINNNMTPIRADETKNTNLIQLDILKRIIQSPIAICDMSAKNPNVFYELGMRQAFDLPTVLLIDDNTKVPFDISSLRYITYNKEMSYRNVKTAITNVTNALKETFEKKDDKTEINSLIRLMELTSAKIETSNITSSERIELLHELELKEIKSSINSLIEMQKNMISDSNNTLGYKTNKFEAKNINLEFDAGDTAYLGNKEYGKVIEINDTYFLIQKLDNEVIRIGINSKLGQDLSFLPF